VKKLLRSLCVIVLVQTFSLAAFAVEETATLECFKSAHFLAPMDSADHRKYAPDRAVEVLHLTLDVTPDFKQRTVAGKTTIRFKNLVKPTRELKLDAVDLNVQTVTATERIQGYQVTEDQLVITFVEPIAPEKEASVTITHSAEPAQGLYFRTPEMGYKPTDTHVFTQGEQIEARHWYPCFDSPNDKFTSEVICHVPTNMTVISNGRLVSETVNAATGLKTSHWSQEKPHVNYLITLIAGHFTKLEDKYKDIPMTFYTLPSETAQAINSFRDTKDMMAFFEKEIGIAYPWPKYDQTCVNDFVAGGMENTSATTLNDSTLFTDATENIRSSEGLVAHELAHQWFGDLVTCKDWSHIWLNEGFATYYETLYNGHKNGRDALLYALYGRSRQITGMSNDVNSIVRRTYDDPGEMFGYLAYPKGSWVLHMLRSELGEDLYRQCIKTYLERFQFKNVVTEDLRSVIEEISGQSFDQFFDQWLYHAHHPELEASYSWDEKTGLARVSIRQVQKISDSVLLFNIPVTIRFKGEFGTSNQVIRVKNKEEDFYFSLPSAPKIVRIDPEYTLLMKVNFSIPTPLLHAQLADQTDTVGRLLAIEQLANKKDKETVAKLQQVLKDEPFYGVRIEASRALRSIHSDEALTALLASTKQSDARVRRQVVSDISVFYHDTAYDSAQKIVAQEKNPDIVAVGIRSFGTYAKPEVREALLKFLESESFRNVLADAAIDAIRAQDDPSYIAPLLDTLSKREGDFASRDFSQALDTLAYLARNEEKKDSVREFLVGKVNHKRRTIKLASINALGTLGDPKAIAVLETFATASKESRERTAATRAIASLRAERKPVDEFKGLRQEVMDLQKTNRELRKDLDTLKSKVEAGAAAPATSKSKKPAPTGKGR
jgi:aminopeptidase N